MKKSLFYQFIQTIGSFPRKIIANFNKKHLKTLWYAIQHEPFHVILHNFKNLIYQSDKLQQYRLRDHQQGICLEIEGIHFFAGKLTIKGWCTSKSNIKEFLVTTDQGLTIEPILNLYRPDVEEHLKDYSNSGESGFFIVGNISGATKAITLKIRLENGTEQLTEIAVEEDNWQKQYQQFLAKKAEEVKEKIALNIEVIELGNPTQTNEKVAQAKADYYLFVGQHDKLKSGALAHFQKVINQNSAVDIIYADEVRKNKEGAEIPYFKSDFNLDLLLSTNYIGDTFLVKNTFGAQVGWFDERVGKAFSYDFLLRSVEQKANIQHLPKALVNSHVFDTSKVSDTLSLAELNNVSAPIAIEVEVSDTETVVSNYLKRNNIAATIATDKRTNAVIINRATDEEDLVSIIIPFRDNVDLLEKCVESILEKTLDRDYEILLIDNNSTESATADYLKNITNQYGFIKSHTFNEPFNFSKINNWAVQFAKGAYLLFLNNDTEVICEEWLTEMLSHCQRKEVGAVGAKLLYPDNTLQHAGIILGIFGVAEHSHKYFHETSKGYFNRPNLLQNVTAVTAACMMTKKETFEEVGGFDENTFPITLNDVDFCLKLRDKGRLIVYTPHAKLYHYESKSRGAESTKEKKQRAMQEIKNFRQKWAHLIEKGDPYYNPNLSYYSTDYQLDAQ